MTLEEFIFAVEDAVNTDDRWALSELDKLCTDNSTRRKAIRHADNLILAEKTESEDIAEYSRTHLDQAISKLKEAGE